MCILEEVKPEQKPVQKIYELRLLNLINITVSETVFEKAYEYLEAFLADIKVKRLRDPECTIWYTGNTVLAQVYHRFGETGEHHVLIIYEKNLAEHVLAALLSEVK